MSSVSPRVQGLERGRPESGPLVEGKWVALPDTSEITGPLPGTDGVKVEGSSRKTFFTVIVGTKIKSKGNKKSQVTLCPDLKGRVVPERA